MTSEIWPVGMYAPGDYTCTCHKCGQNFVGDKRARECPDCVIKALHLENAKMRYALERCPPEKPTDTGRDFADRVKTWWRLWARPALGKEG